MLLAVVHSSLTIATSLNPHFLPLVSGVSYLLGSSLLESDFGLAFNICDHRARQTDRTISVNSVENIHFHVEPICCRPCFLCRFSTTSAVLLVQVLSAPSTSAAPSPHASALSSSAAIHEALQTDSNVLQSV